MKEDVTPEVKDAPPIALTETVWRVRDYIQSNPKLRTDKTKFVEGWGWDHTKWLQSAFPTAVRTPPHGTTDCAKSDTALTSFGSRLT